MYSQDEINSAIVAGALSEDAAASLRAHVVEMRERPVTDEEHFRLVSSFNDIFVAIGVVIMLFAVGAIGQAIGGAFFGIPENFFAAGGTDAEMQAYYQQSMLRNAAQIALAGLLVAGTAWLLAEFFTRKRRMALPSILLLLALVGGTAACLGGVSVGITAGFGESNVSVRIGGALAAVSALITAGVAWLHWRRFGVPITIAALAGSLAATVALIIVAAIGESAGIEPENLLLSLAFIAGITIFAFAMRWDMSDRTRQTRRADVAFWLHLLAAPLIAHPVFYALGVTEGDNITIGAAIGVLAVYIVMGLVALAVDRRALLVSALVYVLVALAGLFSRFGAVELNVAMTALVIGSALLTLSAFWSPIRAKLVAALPADLQARLPVTASASVTPPNAATA